MSIDERIGELKQPREMEGFGTEKARDLQHALDILVALRVESFGSNDVAWSKLNHAREHLNDIFRQHLEGKEGRTEREEAAIEKEKAE